MPDPTRPFSGPHGYRGTHPLESAWEWIKESAQPAQPAKPAGAEQVGVYGAPAPPPVAPEPQAIDAAAEDDIQAAIRELVAPPQMSLPGPAAPPQPAPEPQHVSAARNYLQGAPAPAVPPPGPPMGGGGMQRRGPLPPGMGGQSGGMYYPPDFIKDLDLEHPRAEEAIDRFTRYAESPVGRQHDLARTEQAGRDAYGRGMTGAAVLQGMGDEAKAGAYGELRAAEAERFKRSQERRKRMMADYQTEVAKFALAKDRIAQMRVDPERFWASQSTGSKIASAIFLALGSAGAGATGGPNYAMQILDQQISRDIDAQKYNIANRRAGLADNKHLLGLMMQQYDTAEQADAAARVFAYEQTANKVKQIGLTTNSIVTRQKAAAFLGKLENEKAALEKKLALHGAEVAAEMERRRMAAAAQAAQARAEQARKMEQLRGWRPLDEKEARFVIPGWGIAAPTTGESSIPKLRDDAARIMTHNQNLDRAIQIAEKGGTWSTLTPQERDEIQQLYYFVFNPEVKELSGAAVTDSEMTRYQKQFGRDPSSTWDTVVSNVPQSLRRLKNQLNRGFGNKLKSYGVQGQAELLPNPETGRWEWHARHSAPQAAGTATLYDSPE